MSSGRLPPPARNHPHPRRLAGVSPCLLLLAMGCSGEDGDPVGPDDPAAPPPLEASLTLEADSLRIGEIAQVLLTLGGGDPRHAASWDCRAAPSHLVLVESTPDGCVLAALEDGDVELRVMAVQAADSTEAVGSLRIRTPEPRMVGDLMDVEWPVASMAWIEGSEGVRVLVSQGRLDPQLAVVDVSDPTSPRTLSRLMLHERPRYIHVRGILAAALVGTRGLLLVDLSEPLEPEILHWAPEFFPPDTRLNRALILGDDLFVTSQARGLHRVDLRDPGAPTLRSSLRIEPSQTRKTSDLVVMDGRLLVGVRGVGVAILEVDPGGEERDEPVHVATVPASGVVRVALDGSTAWVASFSPHEGAPVTLSGWDLANPMAPVERSVMDLGVPESSGMVSAPGRLYLSGWTGGLLAMDTSDPDAPRLLGSLSEGNISGPPLPAFPYLVTSFSQGVNVVDLGPWVPRPRLPGS